MKHLIKYLIVFTAAFIFSGSAVYLGIGLFTQSADEIILPELKEKNIIYVLETLTQMGLNAKLYGTRYHDTIPRYAVISQDPEPGSTIKKGRDVVIYLSRGQKLTIMPDLRQTQQDQAFLLLEKNEFLKGHISYTYSTIVKTDHVIAQYPNAFSTTPRQTACNLLISSGPRPAAYVMPELKGLPIETAAEKLSRIQIPIAKIQSQKTSHVPNGEVLKQTPIQGSKITRQTTSVSLTISNVENGRSMNPEHLNKMILFTHRLGPGFLKRHVRVETDMFGQTLNFYDELMKPGSLISILAPADKPNMIHFYIDHKLVKAITIDPWKKDLITGEKTWELSPPQFYPPISLNLEMN